MPAPSTPTSVVEAPRAGADPTRPGGPRLPDLIVIGAAKCGTTTLHHMLERHPGAWMYPGKEAHFFTRRGDVLGDLDWYEGLFADAPAGTRCGEATPGYLHLPWAIGNLARTYAHRGLAPPAVVVVLRNPAERAYSQYWHNVRLLPRTPRTFEAALADEPRAYLDEGRDVACLIGRGRYLRRLQVAADELGRDRLCVVLLEDLLDAPHATLDRVAAHVGLEAMGDRWGTLLVANPAMRSRVPRRLRAALGWKPNVGWRQRLSGHTLEGLRPPPMAPLTRQLLVEVFREENQALGEWLGRDLSGWDR